MDSPGHREIKEFYDHVYYGARATPEEVPRHLRRLANRFRPWREKKILDVACGAGAWLRAAAALGAVPSGVDISKVALDICRKDLPNAELYCGPAERLPFADGQFDFVSCLGALEHFIDPAGALREMVRVSKPDAQFLLLVPNAGFPPLRLGLYGGTEQSSVREEIRSLDDWRSLFDSTGLTILKRWRDLHVLSAAWITLGPWYLWPVRLAQSLMLPVWPLSWQYQVYHHCSVRK